MPPNKSKTDVILEKLDQLQKEQHDTAMQVQDLVLHIKGNGGKGLHQRMDAAEKWQDDHPAVCPLSAEELHKRRMREIALYGVIVAVISLAVNIGWPLVQALIQRGG